MEMTSDKELLDYGMMSEGLGERSLDVKPKKSSNASLLMTPVASGDNVALLLNSAHKLKDSPHLVPCCDGTDLQINEELVHKGLSMISLKNDQLIHSLNLSTVPEKPYAVPGIIKHRNSFRNIHRPDLKRIPYLRRLTPGELETLFRGYSDLHDRISSIVSEREDDMQGNKQQTAKIRIDVLKQNNGAAEDAHLGQSSSGHEELPIGMRLHGAQARIYTSVLAGAKAGDQLDGAVETEEYKTVPIDLVPEEEVLQQEEVQIILPPQCDDDANSCITTSNEFSVIAN